MICRRLAGALLATTALVAGCGGGTSTSAGTQSNPPTGTPAANAGSTGAAAAPTGAASAVASPKYSDLPSAAAATAPCGTAITPHPAAAAKLPAGFPVLAGWTPTGSVTQGSTTAVRGVVVGRPAQISSVRDAAFARILAAGYRKTGSDQEPGFEADGDFAGPHAGNINVKTLCSAHLILTYTFTS